MEISINENDVSGVLPLATGRRYPYEWAREMVINRTTKTNNIPFFYKECLRFIISRLGNLAYINSEDKSIDIKCIYANPERVVSNLKKETNIILPIISISQTRTSEANDRRRLSSMVTSESWWSDKKKRAFRVLSIAPRAANIEYSINVWAKFRSNLDQISEQIRLLFNPDLVIVTEHTTSSKAFIVDESDQSNVETSDREDRLLRRSFSIKLEGYIPNPKFLVTATGEIEEFVLDSDLY